MKTFLTINIILLFLNACSYDNAFSRFEISEKRAKSEESIVSAKIYKDKEVIGLVNCVYLNKIYPEKYQENEVFYVYLYAKEKKEKITFSLNDINASSVEELDVNNDFTPLTSSNMAWQKYYLVKFAPQEETLVFKVSISEFASDAITFKKDE